MNNKEVSLVLLKQLVSELESALETAKKAKGPTEAEANQHVIEMAKASGIAAGIANEATMLILDIQAVAHASQAPMPKSELLNKLLGLKGGTN